MLRKTPFTSTSTSTSTARVIESKQSTIFNVLALQSSSPGILPRPSSHQSRLPPDPEEVLLASHHFSS
ncbi:uncharacterized protein L3040_006993 [Drepanopeziza brunnea f. sp. 'multigermtubi']|uniref:uncharacterized protein n=1 Tax=Drepanopeziza brunnea f. sp. 'multigermtubi' TaxID=698441 RepID=UPI0023922EE5|nr:hypothetical protein L3040_006993 [Drepanopeziza brunnea f. sp. 'multigermtubi']